MDNSLEKSLQNTRLIVIGNERYPRRAEQVMMHLRSKDGWIGSLKPELRVGADHNKRYAPQSYKEMRTWPHWWAASCDHIDAMEDSIVSRCHHMLILEDDAHLSDEFDSQIIQTLQTVAEDWKAIRLGWNASGHTGMIGTLWSRRGMIQAYDYFQCHRDRVIDRAFADLRKACPSGWYQTSQKVVREASKTKQCGHDS